MFDIDVNNNVLVDIQIPSITIEGAIYGRIEIATEAHTAERASTNVRLHNFRRAEAQRSRYMDKRLKLVAAGLI